MSFQFSDLDDLPGVTPSRQKRSRETTAALLRAGEDMLRRHSLDELSIEALCAAVDVTVGAFYSRFESKEVYFNALLELAARDSEANLGRIQDAVLNEAELDAVCRALVREIAAWMRNHEGVVRAALQHGDTRPTRWTRFKELGRRTVTHATPLLLRAMGRDRKAAKTRAIGFGFQVVFGTLVNAVLNDPGPLSIADAEMAERLGDCLYLQLAAAAQAAPATRAPPARKAAARSLRRK
ncbi:TetR/AcrR family transcriptional regulator [Bradyrhizobium sp. 2TAF24]|uniref:TetR/AcrR family transcriptional regulator n=1 Tax=Bradyrhizobium sp. 2TAF24 TaxID=3233011 RepID=UPI003F90FBDC